MWKLFRNVSLNSKVMVLTLCITLVVVLATGGIALSLQMKEMKEQLTRQVVGFASLWSSTIEGEEVKKIIHAGNVSDPSYQKIYEHLNLINEKTLLYFMVSY